MLNWLTGKISKLKKIFVSFDTYINKYSCVLLDPCGSAASQSDSHIGTQCSHKEFATIRAHCIVIASRCDWFRKALLSGMRESINKYVDFLSFFNLLKIKKSI